MNNRKQTQFSSFKLCHQCVITSLAHLSLVEPNPQCAQNELISDSGADCNCGGCRCNNNRLHEDPMLLLLLLVPLVSVR